MGNDHCPGCGEGAAFISSTEKRLGCQGGKMRLLGEFQQQSSSLGPMQSGFHKKDLDHQVGNDQDIPLEQNMRENGGKPVEEAKVFQEIGEGNDLCENTHPCRENGNRIVHSAKK